MVRDHSKYYDYIVEDIDKKTIINTNTNGYGLQDTWFSFIFGEESLHHIEYRGGQGMCNIFKLYTPMRRLHSYLLNHHGLKYEELDHIIIPLKEKWADKYNLTFITDEILMRIIDLERKCEKGN